jgi:apolipoprotein N-acyltransferase
MAAFWGFFGAAYGYWLQLKTPVIKPGKPVSNFGAIVSGLEVALIPAALFVLLEYAGAYGFGLLWAGSGSLFGPHWTFGNLAYSLATNSLALKFSSYIGIYGIVFLILLINNALMVIFTRSCKNYHQRLTTVLSTMVVIMVVTIASFFPKIFLSQKQGVTENNRQVNFTIIQTNQPTKISPTPKEILSAFKEQLDLLKRAAKEHPESQLIVFPEASDFFKNLSLFLTGSQIPNYFSNLFKEPRLIIAGARIIDTDGRAYSRVFALDTQKDIIGFYDKRLLTPEGEFLSYPTKFVVNLLSKTKVSEFSDLREFGIGKKRVSTVNFRGQFSVAPLVCSELLAPSLARQTIEGTDIIVGMTSYGVFHGSAVFIKQNLANAQFRAAENRKPLITATNMGLSYAINSEGNVQSMTQNQGAQLLTGGVALNSLKSWYNRVGDFPVLVGSLVLVISFGLLTIFRRTKGGS